MPYCTSLNPFQIFNTFSKNKYKNPKALKERILTTAPFQVTPPSLFTCIYLIVLTGGNQGCQGGDAGSADSSPYILLQWSKCCALHHSPGSNRAPLSANPLDRKLLLTTDDFSNELLHSCNCDLWWKSQAKLMSQLVLISANENPNSCNKRIHP